MCASTCAREYFRTHWRTSTTSAVINTDSEIVGFRCGWKILPSPGLLRSVCCLEPTFRDYLSLPSSVVKPNFWRRDRQVVPKRRFWTNLHCVITQETEDFWTLTVFAVCIVPLVPRKSNATPRSTTRCIYSVAIQTPREKLRMIHQIPLPNQTISRYYFPLMKVAHVTEVHNCIQFMTRR
jgi:hypothetical protein